mmetsp:Transcript_9149/g.23182  ORF Transcript_9149/g.23182 Transcript_9149/m.23182 type:complete len:256 (+) Transcript_9149:2078-2845(+)
MRQAKKFRRIKVSVKSTLVPIIVSVAVNIILLACMTAFDPFKYKLEPTSEDRFGRPNSFQGQCLPGDRLEFIVPLLVFNFFILMMAIFQAWRARNISTEFQETEHIYRALGGIILVLFIGIPVLILVRGETDTSVFVVSAITFIFCLSILLNLFVPKMVYEKERKKKDNTHITGLAPPSVYTANGTAFPSMTSETSDDGDAVGDRILSMKTRRELIEENNKLKQEIRRLQKREGRPNVTAEETAAGKESQVGETS